MLNQETLADQADQSEPERTPPDDAPPPTASDARPRRREAPMLPLPLTLVVLGLTYWCVDMISPTIPVIQADLALSGAGAGLIMSVFFFGRLLTNFPAAFMLERIGPRGCAQVGALILAVGSAGAALAPGEPALLAARGVQGVGVALLATAGLLSVLRAWPAGGAAMTAFNVSAGIGGGLGLFAGGFVTAGFGWRGVFWVSCALACIMLAGSVIAHVVQGRRRVSPAAVAEAAGLATEFTVNRGLVAGIAANLLVYINYSIWVVALALFATAKFGAGPGELGILLLTVNIMHLASALPAGWLIRRLGPARTMVIAFLCAAAGMVFVVLAPTLPLLTPAMALVAAGQMAGNSATGDLVLRLGGGGGRAVGLVRLTSDVGLVLGPVMVGVLADMAGVQAPFLVLAGLTLVGAATTWWFSRPSGHPGLTAAA